MAYPYYQHAGSGWGTSQYQFGPPPAIHFQSQPSWGGYDFYRAHAAGSDPSLFNHAFNRIHEYAGGSFGPGVGMHEARHWHRRAYGGLGEINHMLPEEIGHAAAYEAYRTWIHNSSIHEPLGGDIERQRDGLIGLAIAEASKLLQYTGRSMDQFGRMSASEAAAATASYIFSQSQDMEDFGDGSYRRSRSRSRHNSFSYGSHFPSPHTYGSYENEFDPYAYDRDRIRGSRRHHRRNSSASRLMIGQPGYDTYGSSPIAIPGSSFGGGFHPSSFGGGYAGSYPAVSPSYPVSGGIPYAGSYGGGVPAGGSLIVTTKPKRHRSSSRHHHGRSRSRSVHVIPSYTGSSYY